MPETLVINASPLIFLGNAGQLELLRASGATRFVVPPRVRDKVTDSPYADRAATSLKKDTWIEVAPVIPISAEITEWDLGPGESAVIATSLHLQDARPVLDDLAARKCARAFGLRPIGTVGLVIAAYRLGRISDARSTLLDLRASGMWISDAVIDQALRLAGLNED